MKFIRGDNHHYFNAEQILAFTIEQCFDNDSAYYTVNIIPVRATYNAEHYTVKSFNSASAAENFLKTVVEAINAED